MNALPAYLINRKSKGLAQAAVQGLAGNQGPYISIKSNRFTLIDGAGNEKPVRTLDLDIVIVDVNANVSKIYYEDKYDPAAVDFKPPTCFSDNGRGPSSQAVKPQHPICMTCRHNEWGSAISSQTGKQTKECNDVKKLAVLVPEYDDKLVFQLRVPPATLKNFKAYAQLVSSGTIGDRPVDLSDLVTRVSFESQGILKFEPVDFIDEKVARRVEQLDDGETTAAIVGRNDTPYQGQLASPTNAQSVAEEKSMAPDSGQFGQLSDTSTRPTLSPNGGGATNASPTRGRGRPPGATNKTKGEVAAQREPMKNATDDPPWVGEKNEEPDDIPAFLRRKAPDAVQKDEPVTKPDSELSKALAAAFNLPT